MTTLYICRLRAHNGSCSQIRKSCELVSLFSLQHPHSSFMPPPKAMKTLRTELTGEGRLDILDRVMAYRGGKITPVSPEHLSNFSCTGYSPQVCFLLFLVVTPSPIHRIVDVSNTRRSPGISSESWQPMLLNWVSTLVFLTQY